MLNEEGSEIVKEELSHRKGGITVNWRKVNRLKLARKRRFSFCSLESDFSRGEHRWIRVHKTARDINTERRLCRLIEKMREEESEVKSHRIFLQTLCAYERRFRETLEDKRAESLETLRRPSHLTHDEQADSRSEDV